MTIFDNCFRFTGLIGHGGMSRIYLAKDLIAEDNVVAKVIHFSNAIFRSKEDLIDYIKSFFHEFDIGQGINHAGFVNARDFRLYGDTPVIIQEMADGVSLRDVFTYKAKLMSLFEAMGILYQICQAIDFFHSRGIIHGDVKPENMHRHDNKVKILDLGLAQRIGERYSEFTRSFLTPDYASPEQLLKNQCDIRSDNFAVALMAYELITESHPFRGDSVRQTTINISNGYKTAYPSLTKLNIDPEEWERVFKIAFNRDPDRRYQSCDHFYDDLLGAMKDKDIDRKSIAASFEYSKSSKLAKQTRRPRGQIDQEFYSFLAKIDRDELDYQEFLDRCNKTHEIIQSQIPVTLHETVNRKNGPLPN